jgi:Ca2+-binding EF-hand superfamily protein
VKQIFLAIAFVSAPAIAQQPQMPNLEDIFFKQFDTNQDSQVSKAEFLKPTEAQFDHMDRDKNGALSQAEVKAFNDEMKQRIEEMQQRLQQQGDAPGMPQR